MINKHLFQSRLCVLLIAMCGLLTAAIAQAADVYIPRTSTHFKCKFPVPEHLEIGFKLQSINLIAIASNMALSAGMIFHKSCLHSVRMLMPLLISTHIAIGWMRLLEVGML
jgi:hypothetical protein